MRAKIKNYFSSFSYQHIGIVAIIIQYVFQYDFISSPQIGLDNSWALSINMALKENLNFGTDFIFTYGPLGYLMTSLPVYSSSIAIVIFNLFIISNGIYFVFFVEKKIDQVGFKILFFLIVIYFNLIFIDKLSGLLFHFYFLFHLLCYVNYKKRASFFLLSLFVGISFYIKVNSGLIISILYIFNFYYFYKIKIIDELDVIISLSVIFLIHIFVNLFYSINILSYLNYSTDIINFYNDGMFLTAPIVVTFIAFLILFIFTAFILSFSSDLKKSEYEIFLFFNIIAFLFIAFKQSFVRADLFHYVYFFYYVIYLLIIILVFTKSMKIKSYSKKVLPIIVFFCSLVPTIKVQSKTYLSDFISTVLYNNPDTTVHRERLLPEKILKKIGNSTVDVIPSEISWIFFNDLKYNPRPIIQSYSAYSKRLVELNYNKYISKQAPDFVLYHNSGFIDNHFPLWEDPLIQLALLQHYIICDTIMLNTDSLILFKKQDKISVLKKKLLLDTSIELNKVLQLPKTDRIILLESDLNYSKLGKLRRSLFQNSNLTIQTKAINDSVFNNYKAILPLLNEGLIINKSISISKSYTDIYSDFNDLYNFFNYSGEKTNGIEQIKILANKNYYTNKFRIKLWEISF